MMAATYLTEKQRLFIRAKAEGMNNRDAAIAAGVPEKSAHVVANRWMHPVAHPLIHAALEQEMAKRDMASAMKAEEVRKYIACALKFCPSDYFEPHGRGGWLISPDKLMELPREVRMLIEDVFLHKRTTKLSDGTEVEEVLFRVRFVSKTEALKLAARYTLVENSAHMTTFVQTNWGELAGDGWDLVDPVEEEIAVIQRAKSVQPQFGPKAPPASTSTNGDTYS
jgi:hypothetical protein